MDKWRLILSLYAVLVAMAMSAITVPYTFIPSERQYAQCIVVDNNDDDITWRYDYDDTTWESSFRYSYNTDEDADDWVLFPAMTLPAGTYRISADFKAKSHMEAEKFEIMMGKERSVEGMTTCLLREDNVVNSVYETDSNVVTLTEGGDYYLALHVFSDKNKYNLYVRNVTITEAVLSAPLPPELISMDIDDGVATATMRLPQMTTDDKTLDEYVGAEVYVDDIFVDEVSFFEHKAGEVVASQFPVAVGKHTLRVRSSMLTDWDIVYSDYVEMPFKIARPAPELLTIPTTITPDEDEFDWCSYLDANDDGNSWQYALEYVYNPYDPENEYVEDPMFRYATNRNAADDWIFFPAFDGSISGVYELDMSIGTMYNAESIEVYYGNAPTVEGMGTLLYSNYGFSTGGDFTNLALSFNHTTGENFYIGVRCCSEASKGALNVKGVTMKYGDGRVPKPVVYDTESFIGNFGSISFTLPTENIANEPLDAQRVYADVYLDGEKYKDAVSGLPGESVTFPMSMDFGMHHLEIVCYIYKDYKALYSTACKTEIVISKPSTLCYDLPKTFSLKAEDYDEYVVVDANNDGVTLQSDDKCSYYSYSRYGAANEWLFTPKMRFDDADALYNASIFACAQSAAYPEAFELWLGTEPSTRGMTQLLMTQPAVDNETLEIYPATFNIEQAGEYVVGIHVVSKANMYKLYLKHLRVCLDSDYDNIADLQQTYSRVYSEDGAVVVDGFAGQQLTILSLDGVARANIASLSGYERIPLDRGIYIVVVEGKSFKIAVK